MSKLPKAPLVEVVFELRWNFTGNDELARVQYLYGDIYNELKSKYPYRESILPVDFPVEFMINQPAHRFRSEQNSYPLIQIGPGIITYNTIDSLYEWQNFFESTSELISTFLKIYPFEKEKTLSPGILYLDFFPFDFDKQDAHAFVNENFNVNFDQSFFKNEKFPTDFSMGFAFSVALGELRINFLKGRNNNQEGILLQTRINGSPLIAGHENLSNWLQEAHTLCSDLFKQLTKGKLYESFK